jgi:hypothetical protein
MMRIRMCVYYWLRSANGEAKCVPGFAPQQWRQYYPHLFQQPGITDVEICESEAREELTIMPGSIDYL